MVSHQLVFKEEKDRNVINLTAFLVKVNATVVGLLLYNIFRTQWSLFKSYTIEDVNKMY